MNLTVTLRENRGGRAGNTSLISVSHFAILAGTGNVSPARQLQSYPPRSVVE
jgi:hypothetical protein